VIICFRDKPKMREARQDPAGSGWILQMSTDDQREAQPRIDGQGIALLLIAAMFAFVLGSGALWIGLR
jgi:hypothetical protein